MAAAPAAHHKVQPQGDRWIIVGWWRVIARLRHIYRRGVDWFAGVGDTGLRRALLRAVRGRATRSAVRLLYRHGVPLIGINRRDNAVAVIRSWWRNRATTQSRHGEHCK